MDVQRLQVEALIDLVVALDRAGHHAQAQRIWQEAERVTSIKQPFRQALALRYLARALAKARQWQEAERITNSIKNPAHQAVAFCYLVSQIMALHNIALALMQARNKSEAQKAWQQAESVCLSLKSASNSTWAISEFAGALLKTQQWRWVERIFSLLPAGSSIPGRLSQMQSFFNRAAVLLKVQQWQEAERIATSIHYSPTQRAALHDLATTLDQTGQHTQAQIMWQKAERVARSSDGMPSCYAALHSLTMALARDQQWQEAERIIRSLPLSAKPFYPH